jgi:transposase InsO family protein
MAVVLHVSRTGYYAWRRRVPSTRQRDRIAFDAQVQKTFEKEHQRYGHRRIMHALHRAGMPCTRKRVVHSMARQGLTVVRRRRRQPQTTMSHHACPVAENLLQRQFTVVAPNQVWVTDITYLPTGHGWIYLAVIIDLCGREVVGWAVSDSIAHEVVLRALRGAISRRRPAAGLIVHSDRGVQYCCHAVREVIARIGGIQSMSRRGNCWDNAVAESFFATLKHELAITHGATFETVEHAERVLFAYIECDYNRHRLHSSLGYRTPVEYVQHIMHQLHNVA